MHPLPAPIPVGMRPVLLAALALIAITIAVYWPVGDNGFVDFDDGSYVTQNALVQGGLSAEGLRWAFLETHSSNWHPLTWLSHMLDCELFQLRPRGHHLMALGLHALGAALCFWALLLLSGRYWLSLLAAAFFALHPQRVESVAWISERKDVLSGVFFFACLCAYGLHVRRGGRLYYSLLLLSLALGLLAKQMLVTLPCLLLVLDQWPLKRFRSLGIKRCLVEKLPLFGLVLAAGLMTVYAQSKGGALSSLERLPLDVRVANGFWATAAYMGKLLWPVDLAFFYPHPYLVLGDEYAIWRPAELGAAALVLCLSVMAFRSRERRPWLLTGWLWYLGLLAPVVGIVHVGAQSMADRYAYLPTIGLYIAILWSAAELASTAARARALWIGALLLLLAMIPLTRAQISTWKDSPTLFEHALASTQRNYIAHSNYGFYLQKRGERDQAEFHYLEALKHAPKLVDSHSNLGAIYIDRQEWDKARAKLQQALRLNPSFTDALMLLGLLEEATEHPEAALDAYARAQEVKPDYALAIAARARMLRQLGRLDEGLRLVEQARARGGQAPELWIELALLQQERAAPALAAQSFSAGLARYPGHIGLRVAAAVFFASCADPAWRDAQRAQKLLQGLESARDWKTLHARAAALAALGDFDAARPLVLEAMAAAPQAQREKLNLTYSLYKQGKLQLQ